jgi:hypothetical protein
MGIPPRARTVPGPYSARALTKSRSSVSPAGDPRRELGTVEVEAGGGTVGRAEIEERGVHA